MSSSESIVFFGTDTFSLPSLQALIDNGYTIEAVITKPDAPVGRGRHFVQPPVAQLAAAGNIPVIQPSRLSELITATAGLSSRLGIVIAYGRILPREVLEHFPLGLINVHPSVLPRYRGPAPIEAAILNGDETTGVSLMQLDEGMDTGPVYVCDRVSLRGNETRPELYRKLSEIGSEMLIRELPHIISGELIPNAQDEQLAKISLTKLVNKKDGSIDWVRPAAYLERQVRAYGGWPGSKTVIDGHEVTVTAARAGDSQPFIGTGETGGRPGTAFKNINGELAVITGHGELIIDRLKPAGKTEMTGKAFLAGHPLT